MSTITKTTQNSSTSTTTTSNTASIPTISARDPKKEQPDPCKKQGCRLQSCYYEILAKSSQGPISDAQCLPLRRELEACREQHKEFYERQNQELFGSKS